MYHVESIHVDLIQDGRGYLSIYGRKPQSTSVLTNPIVRLVFLITTDAVSEKRTCTLFDGLQIVIAAWRQACIK